ncbi:chemotaxis protein CheB [Hymenobacter sp. DG01]|uniref:chemotaxis protein CheB n=1 Tax=Hymenobacter sp. DG01 TaxID=2584940 RepID=UPI00111F442F|nr:chemotaxis protein CheB [Hymenobacter sp. DG01]
MRTELTRLLHTDPELEVVGTAVAANELRAAARRLRPGVVLVGEDQLLGLEQLQRYFPVPVLLYSMRPPLPAMLREVSRMGVYDYVAQLPANPAELPEWRNSIRRKLLAAKPRLTPVAEARRPVSERRLAAPLPPQGVIVIGGSTGGAPAVEAVLRGLPPDFPWAVLVAVHLPELFTDTLVERLRRASSLPVAAASSGQLLRAGHVLVAPGGRNLAVRAVADSPWVGWQTDFVSEASLDVPSVDVLMHSAARVVGRNVLGVVLTGFGQDGTAGARYVRQQGGVVVAQDEATSAVFGMPKSVINAGLASAVLPLPAIADFVVRYVRTVPAVHASHFSPLSQPVQAR